MTDGLSRLLKLYVSRVIIVVRMGRGMGMGCAFSSSFHVNSLLHKLRMFALDELNI